jgi:hypothetical protein
VLEYVGATVQLPPQPAVQPTTAPVNITAQNSQRLATIAIVHVDLVVMSQAGWHPCAHPQLCNSLPNVAQHRWVPAALRLGCPAVNFCTLKGLWWVAAGCVKHDVDSSLEKFAKGVSTVCYPWLLLQVLLSLHRRNKASRMRSAHSGCSSLE